MQPEASHARRATSARLSSQAFEEVAHLLQRFRVERVFDIGAQTGRFAMDLRRGGFPGDIYSVEPQATAYEALLANARGDLRWFPLTHQGVGATPVRYTRILRPEIMRGIHAVKLDTRSHDAGALEEYLPLLDGLRVLILEQTAVRPGGRDPPGFEQLGLAAAETGASDGELDSVSPRYCVYQRVAQRREVPASAHGVQIGAIVTSVGGTLERRLPNGEDLGPLWLHSCTQSWFRMGAPVLSVSERAPPQGIRWVRTDARPSMAQILSAATAVASSHVLLTNADIAFTDAFEALLPQLHPEAAYYGSRFDVERSAGAQSGLTPRGLYELGFDYFLLPAALIKVIVEERLLPEELRVGEPWWDYLLPLLALARGFPVKKLYAAHPLALHYVHPTRYADSLWARNRDLFLSQVTRLLRDPHCYATGLLSGILACVGPIPHLICRGLP